MKAAFDKFLPDTILKLIRAIHAMLNSSNRRHNFELLQELMEVAKHKILHLAETRWLSLQAVAIRIWEQWNPLYMFALQNDHHVAEMMAINTTEGHELYHYFTLLRYILPKINNLNKFFQSKEVIVHLVQDKTE